MSRQDQFSTPAIDLDSNDPADGDTRLQIDLRLKLDEVAEVEAELMRANARRQPSRKDLCHLAAKMYDARRAREKFFDQRLFGEPAWDMLLALYVLPTRGEMLRPTALVHAASVPPTTGIRWQRLLVDHGLIERGPAELSPKRQFVRLTDMGRELMERYLTRIFFASTPVPRFPERAGG